LPEVALEFLNGPSQSTHWPVHRVLSLIGSASGCKLRLADPSVSRFHASLVRTRAGFWVVDMLGESGITVNSASVRFSRLEAGDVLEIGRYQMRIQSGWQGQDTDNPPPGSRSLSTLRLQNSEPNRLKLPDRTAAAMGFAPESGSPKEAEIPLLAYPLSPSPNVEIMPSAGAYPVKPGHSDSTESMLVPLVNQFAIMQQQMLDQFQQTMSMLVHTFGKMHRDQMDVIHAELSRLHELTEEIQSIKDELAKTTSGARGNKPSEKAHPSATPHRLPSGGNASSPATEQPQSAGSRSQLSPGDSDAGADTDKDTLIWLHQRITAIQNERESRWQKILKLLPGVS